MSLRYLLPQLGRSPVLQTDLVRLPARKPAGIVEFRRGCNMAKVVADVLGQDSVDVSAAMGSGKSTVLPAELCKQGKVRVFHVVPSRLLALDLFNYLNKCGDAGEMVLPPVAYMEHVQIDVPKRGLVLTGAAEFVAYLLRLGHGSPYSTILDGAVVCLDEAHESDVYTEVLRNICLELGASHVVRMSATFKANDFRRTETGAQLERKVYPSEETPETWNLAGNSNPWCVARLRNNLLVFTDSRAQVDALRENYTDHGFIVHRLTASMSDSDFVLAMAEHRNKKGALVVLLADYTFRSGFTFDVGTIIDTGRVSYFDVEDKTPVKRSRRMFRIESEQGANRGARIAGQDAEYYMPDLKYEAAVCELEGVEAEAASLLYRAFGFFPPKTLVGTKFFEKYPKADLGVMLRGRYPVTLYEASDKPIVETPVVSRVGTPVRFPSELPLYEEVAGETSKVPEVPMAPRSGSSRGGTSVPSKADSRSILWNALSEVLLPEQVPHLNVGHCYCVDDTVRSNAVGKCLAFPRGLPSVMRMLDSSESSSVVNGLRTADHDNAVCLVLDRYNVLNVELLAMLQALGERAAEIKATGNTGRMRDYLVGLVEEASALDGERHDLLHSFQRLVYRWCEPTEVRDVDELVAKRSKAYVDELDHKLEKVSYDRFETLQRLEQGFEDLKSPVTSKLTHGGHVTWEKHRRRSSRSSRLSGSSDSSVEIRPPRWLGVKSITYTSTNAGSSVDGERVIATVKPGKLLRKLTGEKQVTYPVEGKWLPV